MEKIWKNTKKDKKNKFNVVLESFLLKKVKIEDVHFFSNNNNSESDSINEKNFYVCTLDEDIIREALNSKKSNININLAKIINPSRSMIFKIGPLIDQTVQEKKENPNGLYYAVLVNLKVGNFQTYFDTENPEKEIDKSKLIFTEKECYFIHKKSNDEFNTDNNYLNKKLNYYFVTTNDLIVKPDCLITFKYDNFNDHTCSYCKQISKDLKYCLNDKLYFCEKCDEAIHNGSNKTNYNSLKKHKRISNMDFTVTHDSICTYADHDKPYEIYCSECEELYCITCLGSDVHVNHADKKQSIIYINDGLLDKITMEQNLLNKDMETMTRRINNKINEYEKHSKMVEGFYSEISKEITDRKNKAVDGISKETLKRTTYLMCSMMELQRLMWEIDSKIGFLKTLYIKNDFPKFLSMCRVFDDYIKNDFLKNLKIFMDRNLDGLADGFHKMDQKKK